MDNKQQVRMTFRITKLEERIAPSKCGIPTGGTHASGGSKAKGGSHASGGSIAKGDSHVSGGSKAKGGSHANGGSKVAVVPPKSPCPAPPKC